MNQTVDDRLNAISFRNPLIFIPLTLSILITLFLFYIDEGYYSFAWMLEPWAWVPFSIYVFIFFSIQVFLFGFFFNVLPNLFKGKIILPTLTIISFLGLVFIGLLMFILFRS